VAKKAQPCYQRMMATMSLIRIVLMLVGLMIGGWLASDGVRACVVGDYLTPRSGPRAGQLGPWAKLLASAGIDPRSMLVKSGHIALGVLWLAGVAVFLLKPAVGWWLLFGAAAGTLWYLPAGTALSVVVLALLFLPALRNPA
jgi:hypothetical protein